jgi:DNA-binding transcriptional LysR family regulator
MRHQFQDPLFVRTRNGMEPTPKAEQLSDSIVKGLTFIRAGLNAGTGFDPTTSRRQFTVLMTDVGEIAFLPKALRVINETAPNIELNIVDFAKEHYAGLISTGGVDLAIGLIDLSQSLSSQQIHTGPYVAIMSSDSQYLQRDGDGRPFITLEDYLRAPHVHAVARGSSFNPLSDSLRKLGYSRRIALSIPHQSVLPMILKGTDLLATVGRVCAEHIVVDDQLCQVPVPLPLENTRITMWWHDRNTNDPGHRWLRNLFADIGGESRQFGNDPATS